MPLLSRRHFIGTALSAFGAATVPLGPTALAADARVGAKSAFLPGNGNPFVYSFNIGAIEAWSISDGHMLFTEGVRLMWPPDERAEMAQYLVDHGERTDGIPLYVNVLVLRHGREIVLFDSGFGLRTNSNIGWLAAGLASIGITPDQVTHAILSHG